VGCHDGNAGVSMAITTLDQVIAGCEPPNYFFKNLIISPGTRSASSFNTPGIPGTAVISTAGLGGEALTSYPGQLPFTNPPAGQKAYLARLAVSARTRATFTLCDRVWHNSGFNVTTTAVQNFTGCPDFNRDINNAVGVGEGIFVGVEYYAPLASSAAFSITYTNSAGVSGRTGSTGGLNTAMTTNGFAPITLQTGDLGVRSIQSASFSVAAASGTVSFIAYRPITIVGNMLDTSTNAIDALTSGLPEIYNDSVLFFIMNGVSSASLNGSITFTKG
jgi:hypothetical protein